MLDHGQRDKGSLQAVRAVYIVSPDKKIRAGQYRIITFLNQKKIFLN